MTIYSTLKRPVTGVVRQFFRAFHVRGKEPPDDVPVIFVGNHPNFALDALIVTCTVRRELWYLAKSTLFVPLTKPILRALHMLPVYRRHESDTGKNDKTFEAATDLLCGPPPGAILLFPEGMSIAQREILPVKTGAARLAFQSYERDKRILLQPIGLTYTELHTYRGSVTVTFTDPIYVGDFVERHRDDPHEGVRKLTAEIEQRLRDSTPELADPAHARLAEDLTLIFESAARGDDDLVRMQAIAARIKDREASDPQVVTKVTRRVERYLDIVRLFGFSPDEVSDGSRVPLWKNTLAPLLLLGAIINYIPYRLTGSLALRLSSHPVTIASYKFAIGVLLFGSWFFVISFVAAVLLGLFGGVITFCALSVLAKVTASDFEIAKQMLLGALWPGKKSPHSVLRSMRDDLIEELEKV